MPRATRKRKLSGNASENMESKREKPITNGIESGLTGLSHSLDGLLTRFIGSAKADPTNPVINGAAVTPEAPVIGLIKDLAKELPRTEENIALIASLTKTQVADHGFVNDREYQMEKILQLAASLPTDSGPLNEITSKFIKLLWNTLKHPPLSYQGNEFKYRTADGSNNNIMYPHIGKAGSSYARTVAPQTLQPGLLPDPGVIFDTIYARGSEPREHPNRLSSMLFYLAAIIIHDCFHTDEQDYSRVKTSSYLDLAPLYGSNIEDQKKVRTFKDGLLKPDTFSESRILGFPPGVSALLICFNRYHNYVAMQLKEINEGGRFKLPRGEDDVKGQTKLDEDLFQTARLVTCGLYVNIILIDYVRTILNLNRTDSTWTLDPRKNFPDVFDANGTPFGIGNQVSVEFNLIYRWHSAISVKDEKWTNKLYQQLFPDQNISDITEVELVTRLRQLAKAQDPDPSKWTIDSGKYQRNERGAFRDEDLANLLSDATEDVACAFGPRNVPIVMKLIETMGMKQARAWNVATLNEFRKFFKLNPYTSFSEVTKNKDVARSLQSLYQHPDYIELYPGLVAEDAKDPIEPGSGLCPGFTVSRTILADAVALTRGDRFYTVDYTPANLTNWGWNQVKSDTDVAQGGVFYNLLMRALPFWYRGNSVYAMFPMTVPEENRLILEKLGKAGDYNFDRPSYVAVPTSIKSWKGVTSVLGDQGKFRVPWGPHTFYLTGQDYMLSGDSPANVAQHHQVENEIYCPVNGLAQVQTFYEDLTTQLVTTSSQALRDDWYQLDACRDVGNPSHAIFVARMFHIPLKAADDVNPVAVEVDQLYIAMAVMFAYVFLDLDTARSFKLRSGAKTAGDQISKLIGIVCKAVKVDSYIHLSDLFSMGRAGELLGDYGTNLLRRMFEGGKSVDEVVWEIIPTAAAAVATQAQHFAQMLDIYLMPEYARHWPDIQACAWSNDPADFEKLKMYALEANRLAPAAFGLLRKSASNTTVADGDGNGNPKDVNVHAGDQVYVDFVSAGLDASVFPNPREIDITRDSKLYIHHGWGAHACIGRRIVEVSMASQLKVFAKLKNLRRAPGPQGQMKKTSPTPNPVSSDPQPSPGTIDVYMKEDFSDWWPFPTTLKVHHDGFFESQDAYLAAQTGVPEIQQEIANSDMMNGHGPVDDEKKAYEETA